MAITKGTFVTIDYTGTTADGFVFDTTKEAVAKEHNMPTERAKSMTVCVGEGFTLKGLDASLEGKEPGQTYSITLAPEDAFGKKDAKQIQLISMAKFKAAKLQPQVGLQVTVDETRGVVRRVGGGRVLVDFNHPLAGQDISYEVTIGDVVTDMQKQVDTVMERMGMPIKATAKDGVITFTVPAEMPEQLQTALAEPLNRLIKDIKDIKYVVEKKEEAAAPAEKASSQKA